MAAFRPRATSSIVSPSPAMYSKFSVPTVARKLSPEATVVAASTTRSARRSMTVEPVCAVVTSAPSPALAAAMVLPASLEDQEMLALSNEFTLRRITSAPVPETLMSGRSGLPLSAVRMLFAVASASAPTAIPVTVSDPMVTSIVPVLADPTVTVNVTWLSSPVESISVTPVTTEVAPLAPSLP
jgi:hypothetical protein